MTDTKTLQTALQDGIVIFDGAMGTEIYRQNVATNRCFDELSLSVPDQIRSIHEAYCEADADVLTTNTFGANRLMLSAYGLGDKVDEINRASVALARGVAENAGRQVFVAGSVGPALHAQMRGLDRVEVLREQVQALVDAGVDVVTFETQPTRMALEQCAEAMQERPDAPFILSFTVFDDGESCAGESVERLLETLPDGLPLPIAWSMNCGAGPNALLSAAERAIHLVELPLILQPNAGMPREVGGRQIYFCSPDYLAGYAKRYLDLGISGIGGCCGTTPDHIREIAQRIKPLAQKPAHMPSIEVSEGVELKEPSPFGHKSRLAWRLAHRKWVDTVEIVPPRGYDLTKTIEKAKILHRHGVDALNLPDGPRASSRLSPLVTAAHVLREAQIEPILHFCCRDRNLIGMQADLLACGASDIRNILFVTGDPPKLGNYPFASGVFDVDSIGICQVQKRLNQGVDIGGQAITPQTHAAIGVGADPTALDQDREVRRFHAKVEAGAEYAITQPVFDPEALLRFLDRIDDYIIPILAGIWPLASYRNAQFLQNEIPGVIVPDATMERMASMTEREDQRKMGIEIARESVERVRDRVAGIQVSAPFGNIDTALGVIEH